MVFTEIRNTVLHGAAVQYEAGISLVVMTAVPIQHGPFVHLHSGSGRAEYVGVVHTRLERSFDDLRTACVSLLRFCRHKRARAGLLDLEAARKGHFRIYRLAVGNVDIEDAAFFRRRDGERLVPAHHARGQLEATALHVKRHSLFEDERQRPCEIVGHTRGSRKIGQYERRRRDVLRKQRGVFRACGEPHLHVACDTAIPRLAHGCGIFAATIEVELPFPGGNVPPRERGNAGVLHAKSVLLGDQNLALHRNTVGAEYELRAWIGPIADRERNEAVAYLKRMITRVDCHLRIRRKGDVRDSFAGICGRDGPTACQFGEIDRRAVLHRAAAEVQRLRLERAVHVQRAVAKLSAVLCIGGHVVTNGHRPQQPQFALRAQVNVRRKETVSVRPHLENAIAVQIEVACACRPYVCKMRRLSAADVHIKHVSAEVERHFGRVAVEKSPAVRYAEIRVGKQRHPFCKRVVVAKVRARVLDDTAVQNVRRIDMQALVGVPVQRAARVHLHRLARRAEDIRIVQPRLERPS